MKRPEADSLLRGGPEGWELWTFPRKGEPVCVKDPGPRTKTGAATVLALPARDVLAVPLWMAAEGDAEELAGLELSARHLLRREAAVTVLPIEEVDGRRLVLAVATADDATASPWFGKAGTFDLGVRMLDAGGADGLVWKEFGELCFAFFRAGQPVFLAATGETAPGSAFCGAVQRAALRLKAESVLGGLPRKLQLVGEFPPEDRTAVAAALRCDVTESASVPPALPEVPLDAKPPAARAAEIHRAVRSRWGRIATALACVYLAIAVVAAGKLVAESLRLSGLERQSRQLAPEAGLAETAVKEWREFRAAIDPGTFLLDQLAAVSREIPANDVRLTEFSFGDGRLRITGEATDVSQAYTFFERVKASPDLQEYDWTSRQPQLAGRSKVRFEIEGSRPDAQTQDQ